MKKFNLSVAAVLAMSTFAIAGGDIEPVMEPVVEIPVVVEPVAVASDAGGYVGLGYSYIDMTAENPDGPQEFGLDGNAFTLVAGYNFNQYIAIEGRYSMTMGDLTYSDNFDIDGEEDIENEMRNTAIYVKPMLPLGGATLYGLLGYGHLVIDFSDEGGPVDSEDGFQWGVGASMDVNDNLSIFVDYTRLYDDENFADLELPGEADIMIDSWNVGLTYKF